VTTDVTPARSASSLAGAIIVGGFIWIVFDNLALGLIGGLIAAGAMSRRAREQAASAQNAPEADDAA
jgi:hypothetical protein